MEPTIQLSLDLTNLDAALAMARAAVRTGVDWLAVSTPLLFVEGSRALQALRQEFPYVPIIADLKTMDDAGLEAEIMFQAGASMVVVMGQAHDESIIEQVKVAERFKGKVMCDVMLCANKPARARQAEEMGVDYISVHTGSDERNLIKGLSPLDDLKPVLAAVTIPVQVVGGLAFEQMVQSLDMGAQIVALEASAVTGNTVFTPADPKIENNLREMVVRIKKIKIGHK